ncbi:hypothetical protein [Streptomyces sp. NPDC093149]|uniref:hypothetical protein n=1 Tax=Streptomyces sp. NPDC093149 TaxID=3366031 RepID=UPI00381B6881
MILLVGWWDRDANLIIESSRELPDDTPRKELEAEANRKMNGDQNGWAASFLVDSHKAACQEAYETHVREPGIDSPKLIDEAEGFTVET